MYNEGKREEKNEKLSKGRNTRELVKKERQWQRERDRKRKEKRKKEWEKRIFMLWKHVE